MLTENPPSYGGALVLIVFGTVITSGFFASLLSDIQLYHTAENLAFTTLFGFTPLGIGTYQYFKVRRQQKLLSAERCEYELIRLAAENQGAITAVDVAIHLETSHEKAKNLLNTLHQKGVFSLNVHEEGVVVYHLNDFLHSKH